MKRSQIVLLAGGTLGDVLPLLVLGRALAQAGRCVRIVSHARFRQAAEARGLDWAPLEGDPNALLADPMFDGALRLGRRPLRSLRDTLRYLHAARAEVARMLGSAWRAAQGAGCVVVGLPTTWGQTIAERLDVPCVWALFQPIGVTGAFASPLQPWSCSLGSAYNRLSHLVVQQSLWRPWRAELSRWRSGLGLPGGTVDPFAAAERAASPFVFLFSPQLVPRPADWPAHYIVAGHWRADVDAGWRPAHELERFVSAGTALFVGFGSMSAGREHELAGAVFEAARRSGQRIVLQMAHPDLIASAPTGVLVIGPAPHDWLLSHTAAAIHHGGSGTTHAALRAGLPAAAVPFGVDQLFWANRVAALDAGLPALPERELRARLAPAFARLLGEPGLRANARALAELLRDEDGIAVAAGVVGRVMAG